VTAPMDSTEMTAAMVAGALAQSYRHARQQFSANRIVPPLPTFMSVNHLSRGASANLPPQETGPSVPPWTNAEKKPPKVVPKRPKPSRGAELDESGNPIVRRDLLGRRIGTGVKVTLKDLEQNFHLCLKDAADNLGVCRTTLKRVCRKYGYSRWPRKSSSIHRRRDSGTDRNEEDWEEDEE